MYISIENLSIWQHAYIIITLKYCMHNGLFSRGQKRSQGQGNNNKKSKKPRFDAFVADEKDDSKIFVDPVLIEKRFNIW